MATVFRGVDRKTGRAVAIKLLAVTEERARQRLLLEAQALARLRHANVVSLLDAGEEQGRPWLAVELVRGRSTSSVADARVGSTTWTTALRPHGPRRIA